MTFVGTMIGTMMSAMTTTSATSMSVMSIMILRYMGQRHKKPSIGANYEVCAERSFQACEQICQCLCPQNTQDPLHITSWGW